MNNFVKSLGKTAMTCALGLSMTTNIQAASSQPNVVFMMADNLGWGDVSANNLGTRGGFVTPNIDQIAEEGVNLTQFLVEPGCTPSRAGLMTGRYSVRSGLSLVLVPGMKNKLEDEEYTMGEMFQDAGYNTMYVGKWHLDGDSASQPQNSGFDGWKVGFSGTTDAVLYRENSDTYNLSEGFQKALDNSGYIIEADGPGEAKKVRPYDLEYRLQIEEDITQASIEYIKESAKKDEPFFITVGFTRPHFPNDVSEEWEGVSGIGKYGDSVMELDHRVGQITDAIEKAGIEDNTIVVFISENGPTTTATVENEKYRGNVGPFRGELGELTEGSIRTVGMIKWPGVIKEDQRSNEMFAIHDFMPTFADHLGIKLPTDRPYDGVSQKDFLAGKKKNSNRESFLSFVGTRLGAVRYKQFRMYNMETIASGGVAGLTTNAIDVTAFPQIYNIEADPQEKLNIINENGYLLGPYIKLIKEFEASTKKYPNPPQINLNKLNYGDTY